MKYNKKIILIFSIIFILTNISTGKNISESFTIDNFRVDFFEEFPTYENLSKAELIDFPSTIYISAYSYEEFLSYKETLETINPTIEVAYWPIINGSYWISPFSDTEDLEKLIDDLKKNSDREDLKVLLDLERPYKSFYFNKKEYFSFIKNKNLIRSIFLAQEDYNISIITAEYPSNNFIVEQVWQFLGISYPSCKYQHEKIIMFYSVWFKPNSIFKNQIQNYLIRKNKYEKISVGVGIIGLGRPGTGEILSPEALNHDIQVLYENGIEKICIFRLGGLNQSYVDVINNYV
jgi:hypothetical protein